MCFSNTNKEMVMLLSKIGFITFFLLMSGCALGMLYFAWVSHREEEPYAARRALVLALLLPIPYLALPLLGDPWQTVVAGLLLALTALAAVVLLLPIGNSILYPS